MFKKFISKMKYSKNMNDFYHKIMYMDKFKTFTSNGKLIKKCVYNREEETINLNYITIVEYPDDYYIYIDSVCVCRIKVDCFDNGSLKFNNGFDKESQEKLFDMILNSVEYDNFYKENEKEISSINNIFKNI